MKKTFILLIILGALVITVSKVSAQVESDGIITTTPNSIFETDAEAALIAAKFQKQIEILNAVKLDSSVLSNPSFTSLEDKSKVIPDEEYGRLNPFAPF